MNRGKSLDIKCKEHIEHFLAMAQNDLVLASQALGLTTMTLRRRMKRLATPECTVVRKSDSGSAVALTVSTGQFNTEPLAH